MLKQKKFFDIFSNICMYEDIFIIWCFVLTGPNAYLELFSKFQKLTAITIK